MSQFRLRIKTSGAAFGGADLHRELADILRKTAANVEGGQTEGVLFDVNGNQVGEYVWEADADRRDVGGLDEGDRFRFEGEKTVHVVEHLFLADPGEETHIRTADGLNLLCDVGDIVEVIS